MQPIIIQMPSIQVPEDFSGTVTATITITQDSGQTTKIKWPELPDLKIKTYELPQQGTYHVR